MGSFFEVMLSAIAEKEPFALGIISEIKGSSPQKRGAKAIFMADGRIHGTLGGGCLEAEVRDRARRAVASQKPATFDLLLDHDFGWDDGLICGGRVSGLILPGVANAEPVWKELALRAHAVTWGVTSDFQIAFVDQAHRDWLYTETVSPQCRLWIAGSGHVAQAVTPLAQQLDFDVTVFDDRAALTNYEFFPKQTHLRVDSWERLLQETIPNLPTLGLIATRGHQHDALALRHWVQRPFVFLGMIGSRRKRRLIFTQFVEDKIATAEQLERVACPVGLDIHAVSVPEIALSVMAQFVQIRAEIMASKDPRLCWQTGSSSS